MRTAVAGLEREREASRTEMKTRQASTAALRIELERAKAEAQAAVEKSTDDAARRQAELEMLRRQLVVARTAPPPAARTRASLADEATVTPLEPSPTTLVPEAGVVKVVTWPAGAEVYLTRPKSATPCERAFLGRTPLRCTLPHDDYQLALRPPASGPGVWAVASGSSERFGAGREAVPLWTICVNGRHSTLDRAFWLGGPGSTEAQLSRAVSAESLEFRVAPFDTFDRVVLEKLGRSRVDLTAVERLFTGQSQQTTDAVKLTESIRELAKALQDNVAKTGELAGQIAQADIRRQEQSVELRGEMVGIREQINALEERICELQREQRNRSN